MEYTKKQIDIIETELTPISAEELFDSMVDDCYGTVEILGMVYNKAETLKKIDTIAYQCAVNDYVDSLIGELITEEINGNHYLLTDVEAIIDEIEEGMHE